MLKAEPTPQPDTPAGASTFMQLLNHGPKPPDWVAALCRVHEAVDAAACIARSTFHEPSSRTVLEIARMVLAELARLTK